MIEEEEKESILTGDPNRFIDDEPMLKPGAIIPQEDIDASPPDKENNEDATEEDPQPQKSTARIGLREIFLINQKKR